jgi:uncharacterized protein YbjT (DUF2867 family)
MAQATQIEGVEHFEFKQAICTHIRAIGLPYNLVATVFFMDNFLDSKRGGSMTFRTLSRSLRPKTKMHMLAVDDLGAIVAYILLHGEQYLNQYIDIASDCLTVPQMKEI